MAGLKKSELIERNTDLRNRVSQLEDALRGGMLAGAMDAMAEGVADAVILVDGSHRVVHFNAGAERLFGVAAFEALGHSLNRLFDEASGVVCDSVLGMSTVPGDLMPARAIRTQLTAQRRDGTQVPVQATITGWRHPSGAVRALLLRDLTPVQAAAEAARESEHRFEALAEAAPVGIFRTDLQGRCLYVSARWKEITGLDEADALGDRWLVAIHPEDRARLESVWDEALVTGAAVRAEYRMLHVDGRVVWVLGQSVAERDAAGRVVGYVGTVTDITAQKDLEATLRMREASFRLLFQDNPTPMWVYDLETLRFLEVNEAATWAYGYSREEWLSMTIADIRPEEDVARLMADLAREREPYQCSEEWRHRRRDGTVVPVRFASHVTHFDGRAAVLVVVHSVGAAPYS